MTIPPVGSTARPPLEGKFDPRARRRAFDGCSTQYRDGWCRACEAACVPSGPPRHRAEMSVAS